MKEIKLREFQEGLYRLKGEDWVVYGRGGEIIGRWTAGAGDAKQEEDEVEAISEVLLSKEEIAKQEKKERFNKLKALFDAGKTVKEIKGEITVHDDGTMENEILSVEEVLRCKKCGKGEAIYYWSAWEDGEEYKDYPLCGKCGFRKPGIKLIK